MAETAYQLFDADSHSDETSDAFARYIEPEYRDVAIRCSRPRRPGLRLSCGR